MELTRAAPTTRAARAAGWALALTAAALARWQEDFPSLGETKWSESHITRERLTGELGLFGCGLFNASTKPNPGHF